jgi:nucleotide-binding universal stress UspA family protein
MRSDTSVVSSAAAAFGGAEATMKKVLMLLGSVADRLVQISPKPVLVMR